MEDSLLPAFFFFYCSHHLLVNVFSKELEGCARSCTNEAVWER